MAITYRSIAFLVLGIISYIMTGNVFETLAITVVFTIVATFLYYVHERIWDKIKWGKAAESK